MTEQIMTSGGPEDDAIAAEVLEGDEDLQVPQDAIYIEGDE